MVRLQKFLADAGIASRRKSEKLILVGQIKVNSKIVKELGTKVESSDIIEYNNKIVKIKSAKVYIVLNKPIGYVSSTTSAQGKSVMELVKNSPSCQGGDKEGVGRVYPVGRLDKDSRGLLILTNDGEFTNKLTHAKYGCEKEYEVEINKSFNLADQKKFESGMIIENLPAQAGKKLQPVKVVSVKKNKVRLILKEGINRQIRKMMGQLGYDVIDLKRIRIGKLRLDNLPEGKWQFIKIHNVL